MTQEALDRLREDWAKILRVQDWDLTSNLVTLVEGKNEADGAFIPNVALKLALIEIREGRDRTDDDIELTLIHELIHAHTTGFDNHKVGHLEPAQDLAMEQMVEILARTLFNLKRNGDRAYLRGRLEQLDEDLETIAKADTRRK